MIKRDFSATMIRTIKNPRLVVLLLLSALLLAADAGRLCAQQSEARVALAIANSDYPDAEAPLKDLIGNVRALAEELRRQGFEVDVGENLSKEAMRAAIERFYGKIKPGSAALIFFSGYGIQSNRQTYMIPVNAQIWTEPEVRRDGYSLDSVLAEMDSRGARVKIAILDASRRNPFERRFRSVPAGLAPAIAPNNTAVMYAAAPSMVARDERSLFVTELIKQARIPGKIEEVFNRTARGMREARSEHVPWFSSSLVEEFSLARSTPSQPGQAAQKAVEPAKPKAPPPDPEADARREYQSAERLGTKKAWQDFIAKYPSGRYSDLARDRLARLDTPAVRPKPPEPPKPEPAPKPEPTAKVEPAAKPEPAAKVEAGADDPAIRDLDNKIQLNPNDAAAYYKRGQLYAQHGNFQRSIKDFDEAIRLSPKDAEALNNRCWARAMVGDLQLALNDCNEALQIRPRYVDALDSRGLVSLKLGQLNKAVADYDLALRINPKHASSLYGRGIAKLRTGNRAGGNSDIAAAKAIQPTIADEFASYGVR